MHSFSRRARAHVTEPTTRVPYAALHTCLVAHASAFAFAFNFAFAFKRARLTDLAFPALQSV
eukprot:3533815-Rhodomonas_salina.1